ncbi:cytidine deaminase [candidate division TM6 bacterium RIFCSPHIGHO2_12_FULL_36_22]|nr:MAG: cytidine deaminase [candidate division TM6 bacterium RIFCSPHIGHO2_12_FULL_36_22]
MSLSQEQIDKLKQKAIAMTQRARAPFSNYAVGAAVLCDNDKIIGGCNIENVSYSLTECAERVALFSAVAQGCTNIKALAVATKNLGSPCGACRQVIWELCGDIPIYLVDLEGNSLITSSSKLLPSAFKLQS